MQEYHSHLELSRETINSIHEIKNCTQPWLEKEQEWIDQILTDVIDLSMTTRSNGVTVRSYDEAYSIEFRYKHPAGVVSKEADVTQEFVSQRLDHCERTNYYDSKWGNR